MLGWWKRRKEARRQIEADAQSLIDRLGPQAYYEAFHLHELQKAGADEGDVPERPQGHWERVAYEIGKRTGHDHVDTATRYLGDDA